LFLVLHIEQKFQHLIVYRFVWKEIIELFVSSFVITGIFVLFVRRLRKAAVFALPALLTFYFFPDLKDFLHNWNDKVFLSSYTFLLPLITIVLISIFVLIQRSSSDFRKLFLYINSLFFVLIIYELCVLVIGTNPKTSKKDSLVTAARYSPCDSCARPDIYYLVFDAYTSSAVLRSEFNYNNLQLGSFLAQKNFFEVHKSTSNYNLTPFSIGSTFNLDYLYGLDTRKDFFLNEYLPGVSTVYNSELFKMLKKQGYIIFNHSIFNFDGIPSTIPPFDAWELNLIYKRQNLIKKIDGDIGWLIRRKLNMTGKKTDTTTMYGIERDKHVTNTLNALVTTITTKTNAPKFVYGHILLPHSPYTLDSAGNKLPMIFRALTDEEKKRAYVSQVAYVNKVIKRLVDSIFENAKNNVVIILQGDHGPRFPGQENKKHLEFANLNAMYFYNKDYRLLHDSLSNVNTFRVVFNSFFDKKYPLLKDTSFFLQYK
jgi:Sulfatase